jgi:hypothetical protein
VDRYGGKYTDRQSAGNGDKKAPWETGLASSGMRNSSTPRRVNHASQVHHQTGNDKRQVPERNQKQAQQASADAALAHLTETGNEERQDRGDAGREWGGLGHGVTGVWVSWG